MSVSELRRIEFRQVLGTASFATAGDNERKLALSSWPRLEDVLARGLLSFLLGRD